ncbi:MAG: hypothetical protein R3C53_27005 [Pirellulaceae bacterium]
MWFTEETGPIENCTFVHNTAFPMKRLKQFVVLGPHGTETVSGWHKAYDVAERKFAALLEEQPIETTSDLPSVDILDSLGKLTVARFSSIHEEKIQTESANQEGQSVVDIRWESHPLKLAPSDMPCFAHLNTSDFQWVWLDGATREVPVRLGFLDRRAARNPDGIWGRVASIVAESRDWMFGR